MSTTVKPSRKTVSATEFNAVKHRLAELNAKIEVLQRKSRGATRANAQVAGLQAQVQEIASQLKLAGERYNNASDPAVKADAAGQVYALDSRLTELFEDVSGRVGQLETTVTSHTGTLAEHGTEIKMLQEGQTSLHERVSSITTYGPARVPRWQIVVAIVVGFIAGLIWNAITFTQTTVLDDRAIVSPLDAANSMWAAIGAGIVAALIVLVIFSFFANDKKDTQTTTLTEESVAIKRPSVIRRSVKAATPTTEPDPTPTQVITTDKGADVGARS